MCKQAYFRIHDTHGPEQVNESKATDEKKVTDVNTKV